jgi:hypothetical protein
MSTTNIIPTMEALIAQAKALEGAAAAAEQRAADAVAAINFLREGITEALGELGSDQGAVSSERLVKLLKQECEKVRAQRAWVEPAAPSGWPTVAVPAAYVAELKTYVKPLEKAWVTLRNSLESPEEVDTAVLRTAALLVRLPAQHGATEPPLSVGSSAPAAPPAPAQAPAQAVNLEAMVNKIKERVDDYEGSLQRAEKWIKTDGARFLAQAVKDGTPIVAAVLGPREAMNAYATVLQRIGVASDVVVANNGRGMCALNVHIAGLK